jgi:SAM-dependent methyltransferase
VTPGPPFRSLLYDEPRLYDLVFPDAEAGLARLCRTAFARHLPAPPRSVLDVGCGSGRTLETLAPHVAECWGVDLLESNVAHARARHRGLTIVQGDMRTVRLGRTFDAVTSFGNALAYALTDADLAATVATYAAHAHPGTLLVVDTLNARAYLDGEGFRERIDSRVDTPGFTATAVAHHALDRARRRLTRRRVWRIPGRDDIEDHAEYRLLDPDELARLLEAGGFTVLEIFDNRALRPSDLRGRPGPPADAGGMGGRKIYALARRP